MLRELRRKRARVPLTREGVNSTLPHADGWFSVDEVCGLRRVLSSSAIGVFAYRLRLLASRISPAIVRVSLLTTTEVRGVFSRPFPQR